MPSWTAGSHNKGDRKVLECDEKPGLSPAPRDMLTRGNPTVIAGEVAVSLADRCTGGFSASGWLGVHIQPVDDTMADSLGLGTARGALIASASRTISIEVGFSTSGQPFE